MYLKRVSAEGEHPFGMLNSALKIQLFCRVGGFRDTLGCQLWKYKLWGRCTATQVRNYGSLLIWGTTELHKTNEKHHIIIYSSRTWDIQLYVSYGCPVPQFPVRQKVCCEKEKTDFCILHATTCNTRKEYKRNAYSDC